jgi:hypothetical protein
VVATPKYLPPTRQRLMQGAGTGQITPRKEITAEAVQFTGPLSGVLPGLTYGPTCGEHPPSRRL